LRSAADGSHQPIERRLGITRVASRCSRFRNPVADHEESSVTRDADLLAGSREGQPARAFVSITTLDPSLQRTMGRTSTPDLRLDDRRS
jgi:DNA repair photolyase